MNALINLHNGIFSRIERLSPVALPTLARLAFVATLFGYYWQSAGTKVWDRRGNEGIFDFFTLESGVYAQMFPKAFEAVTYDPSQLGFIYKLVAFAGTYAEWLLPLLILIGLFTRLAALGMIGFIAVQTWVDTTGHGAELGALFDGRYALIDERVLWVFLMAYLVFRGAGPLSLDRLFLERKSAE
ncbi:hypothetical protein AIOL_001232 [Candidatus Rhodobacter oscarellae]|uniref:DoxX n=1 Tax=Candidatus Rhodobacter oscarellae TaxID=1675527 RepID=A0A0J9E0M9_9RHOB|nr:DoxX family membrane protein [Candidatus Rhodobacter lobularis]KMW56280.1 hypothetical protein AIOL_001232 [Candidatus Rhodobacter lobularis]